MPMVDEEIIQLYFDRNEQAITETSLKYGAYCTAIAENILKNSEDAEECVNDTYLKTWNAIPPERPVLFRAYLGKITRNISFNRYKKENAEKRGNGQLSLVLDELAECVSDGKDLQQQLDRKELLQAINDFLESQPQDKRILFVRRYWYADSVKRIAKLRGISENTVSVTLNRMRKNLTGYLKKRGFEL